MDSECSSISLTHDSDEERDEGHVYDSSDLEFDDFKLCKEDCQFSKLQNAFINNDFREITRSIKKESFSDPNNYPSINLAQIVDWCQCNHCSYGHHKKTFFMLIGDYLSECSDEAFQNILAMSPSLLSDKKLGNLSLLLKIIGRNGHAHKLNRDDLLATMSFIGTNLDVFFEQRFKRITDHDFISAFVTFLKLYNQALIDPIRQGEWESQLIYYVIWIVYHFKKRTLRPYNLTRLLSILRELKLDFYALISSGCSLLTPVECLGLFALYKADVMNSEKSIFPKVLTKDKVNSLLMDLFLTCVRMHSSGEVVDKPAHFGMMYKKKSFDLLLVSLIGHMQSLLEVYANRLDSVWWNKQEPRVFLTNLIQVVVKPCPCEELPPIIKKGMHLLDNLLRKSTYTARNSIFLHLFTVKLNHHGLRGHLITTYKNFLHEFFLNSEQCTRDEILHEIEKETIILPTHETAFIAINKAIFRYPFDKAQGETLEDESSWLLSALNFALYIGLRAKAMPEEFTIYRKRIWNDGSFKSTFLNPLKKAIDQEMREREFASKQNPPGSKEAAAPISCCTRTLIMNNMVTELSDLFVPNC